MSRKILFFDIDGTLISEGEKILPHSAVKAIRMARANGHLVFVNTGRTIPIVEENIRAIGFDGYICGCGTYIQIGEKIHYNFSVPSETCKEVVKMLRECQIQAVLEGKEDLYFDKKRELTSKEGLYTKAYFKQLGIGVKKHWDSEELEFQKLFLYGDCSCDRETFRTYITKKFDYIDRGKLRAEIVPKGHSKATGIQFLLDYYHIPMKDAFAFGDSSNDLSMLTYVPNSIAMGNSDATVLNIASYITKHILDDGIYEAIKYFKMI